MSQIQLSLPSAPAAFELLTGSDEPYTGPAGLKSILRIRMLCPEKDAAKVIQYLSSPIFRNELESGKEAIGLSNFGMDVGKLYPEITFNSDGTRTATAYIREVKLTKRV